MEWRLFGEFAEAADATRVSIPSDDVETVADALSALLEAEPGLADELGADLELPAHVTLLHNGEPVQTDGGGFDQAVGDDAELALFPPISGG